MIEQLKIITGTAAIVAILAQEYLSEHPNATVLGTAVATRPPTLNLPEAEPIKPLTKAEKKALEESEAGTPAEEPSPATEPVEDDVLVSITLGHVFA